MDIDIYKACPCQSGKKIKFCCSKDILPDLNQVLTLHHGKQSTAAIDMIQKTFALTEGEKYLLLECGVGEGIFFAGSKHAAIKVVASYTEDQLITSDPRQLLEIEEAKKDFNEQMDGELGSDSNMNDMEID